MVDTSTLNFVPPLPARPSLLSTLPPGTYPTQCWFHSWDQRGRIPGTKITLPYASIRFFLDDNPQPRIHRCEVSLPRLLHTNNSFLIQSQSDIHRALHSLEPSIRSVSPHPAPLSSILYSRVDLTLNLQLPHPVRPFLQVLHQITRRHGRVRCHYDKEGITFGDRKGSCLISFYDKQLQMDRGPGSILRIEIRLRGPKLKELLGPDGSRYPSSLCFSQCYSAFRGEMLRFNVPSVTIQSPQSKRDFLIQAIHLLDSNNISFPDGRRPLDVLEPLYSSTSFRSYREAVNSLNLHSWSFNFSDEFPETWPPPHLAPYVPDPDPDPDPMERYSVARHVRSQGHSIPVALPPSQLAAHP